MTAFSCALPICFDGCELFDFFDGDTFDLYCWRIDVAWVTRWDGHEYIQSLHDLTENGMLVIQVWRGEVCNKEL